MIEGRNEICAHTQFDQHTDVSHKVDKLIVGGGRKGLATADDVILGVVAG